MVLDYTVPIVVSHPQETLPTSVSLLGGKAGPTHRLLIVLRYPTPVVVHYPKESLCVSISLLSENSIRFQSNFPGAPSGISLPWNDSPRLESDFLDAASDSNQRPASNKT